MTDTEIVKEILVDYFAGHKNLVERTLKRLKAEKPKNKPVLDHVNESVFFLNYEDRESEKLKRFQIATQKGNETEFSEAFKVLKNAKATISNRYHGPNYNFSYWIWNDNIYRKQIQK